MNVSGGGNATNDSGGDGNGTVTDEADSDDSVIKPEEPIDIEPEPYVETDLDKLMEVFQTEPDISHLDANNGKNIKFLEIWNDFNNGGGPLDLGLILSSPTNLVNTPDFKQLLIDENEDMIAFYQFKNIQRHSGSDFYFNIDILVTQSQFEPMSSS